MPKSNPTAPAGATSLPESIIRAAAAEAPSPQVFLELDDLLEKLLGVVSHLKCADGVLYDLQSVPEALQPAAIVLHDAVENLDQLHNRLGDWAIKADREARYAAEATRPDSDATQARILAFLRSVRVLPDEPTFGESADAIARGRRVIEEMAASVTGTDAPAHDLTPAQCADVLAFLDGVEPIDPATWWRDPANGPSHVVGRHFVLNVIEEAMRAGGGR